MCGIEKFIRVIILDEPTSILDISVQAQILNLLRDIRTVNVITSNTGAHIYSFINDEGKKYVGEEAAALLLERQIEGLQLLGEYGVKVKINTVAIPGVNIQEIPAIARRMALLGAKLQNILPMLPVEGTAFAHLAEPAAEEIAQLRQVCRQWMPQMQHCNRCRADAVGALTNPCILEES